jgi:hypothetical protein
MNFLAESSNSLIGGLYLILMFLFCFSAVYVAKAVYIMINNIKLLQGNRQLKPAVEEKHQPEKIYYLVERKKAPVRRKVSTEPKRIYFSEKQ